MILAINKQWYKANKKRIVARLRGGGRGVVSLLSELHTVTIH